ncbi:hypothetical protein FRC12_012654 [Ceratobasidium sp. 428]|nr:hypothetical protein FRC12_012654 [Ceratobasidium sp. 428]
MPPDVLARIRQRAEEPLVTWYTASQPSMSREAAREKYKRMSDQEVFNLFLEVRPILGNLKVKVGAMNISAETLAGSPPSIDTTTPNRPSTGLKRSQPTHTPTAAETETPRKLARKPDSLAITVSNIQHEAPALLCVLPGTQGMSKSSLEFTVSAELVTSLKRWKARYLTPAGSHGELRTVELACYSPEAFYPISEGGLLALTPNARTRTWPDGGLLRAFVNEGIRLKGQELQFHLSPPVFTRIDESLDLSEFVQEGKNTIRFLHLGGMEKFVFVVQARRASPPVATWSTVLKRVQEFTENPGYQGLLARLSEKIK